MTTADGNALVTEPAWVIELRQRRWKLAVAESMTAGLLAARLAAQPGSGDVFAGAIVTYHTDLKQRLLDIEGVPVISAECAQAMADGVTKLCDVDVGLAITGVAGPDTQEGKPVGLVYGAITTPDQRAAPEWRFLGDAYEIRTTAVDHAIHLLVHTLCTPPDQRGDRNGGPRPTATALTGTRRDH